MSIETIAEARTLVLVVDGGSLSAAARALHVSPNAVSQRIRAIEARIGTRLLNRTTRTMSLTPEGTALYRRCLRILDEVEGAEADLASAPTSLTGTVRVALPTAVDFPSILRALADLADTHPGLHVQLVVTDVRPVDVVGGAIDIAVQFGQPDDSALIGHRIGTLTSGLCAAPGYLDARGRPASPGDLAAHDCLRFVTERPQDEWTLVGADGAEQRVRVGGWFECDSSRVLRDAVYAGLGIGVRPQREVERAEAAGTLERVLPEFRFADGPLVALMPDGRHRVPRVRAVLDALTHAIREVLI